MVAPKNDTFSHFYSCNSMHNTFRPRLRHFSLPWHTVQHLTGLEYFYLVFCESTKFTNIDVCDVTKLEAYRVSSL